MNAMRQGEYNNKTLASVLNTGLQWLKTAALPK
jgi:hypothetical protein